MQYNCIVLFVLEFWTMTLDNGWLYGNVITYVMNYHHLQTPDLSFIYSLNVNWIHKWSNEYLMTIFIVYDYRLQQMANPKTMISYISMFQCLSNYWNIDSFWRDDRYVEITYLLQTYPSVESPTHWLEVKYNTNSHGQTLQLIPQWIVQPYGLPQLMP